MKSAKWLEERSFRFVGNWIETGSVVHRLAWLRRQPGVYAFVANNEVVYIGKATRLHSRLRNYSRRSFGAYSRKALRRVHEGIRSTISTKAAVSVYVCLATPQTIGQLEAKLIEEAQPAWNVSGVMRPSV
jgi:excinuclease UvrABC nuclease subunit